MNLTVMEELVQALTIADTDADVGTVVLTGAGEKAFCAGADLSSAMAAGDGVYGRHEAGRKFLEIFRNVSNPKKAWEMILSGTRLSAEEAREIGMVNHVVARDELEGKTRELASKLASWSPAAMRLGRRAYYTMRDMAFPQAIDYLHAILTVNTMTEDTMEGVAAFFQKREPQWKGR